MKREVVVAILIGILVGIIFTGGIWIANKSLKQAGIKTATLKPNALSPTSTPIPPNPSGFSVTGPEDNLLTSSSRIRLTGTQNPQSYVIILAENSQYILPASDSAAFAQNLVIETGYNRLKIISLSPSGTQSALNRLVTYSSTASLFSSVSPSQTPTAPVTTGSTIRNTVAEKVAEQIAEIRKNSTKKAYLGPLDSKSDATLNMTTFSGQSYPVTVTAETVIKLANNSEGTMSDLKPGEILLAMGDADASGRLVAKRILVTPAPPKDNRQVLIGEVKSFTGKTLTVDNTVLKISKDTLFQPAKYKFKDVDPGFKLIAVYTSTSTPLIYVLSEK